MKEFKIDEEMFKRALMENTSFPINRYMMSCAHGRRDGAEKATRHIELSEFFARVFGCDQCRFIDGSLPMAIHNQTQILTGHMDEAIGFPLDSRPDYNELKPLFFEEFYRLAVKAYENFTEGERYKVDYEGRY